MEDLIKRSDATEAVYKALRTPPLKGVLTDTMSLAVALVQDIPSADRLQGEWKFSSTFTDSVGSEFAKVKCSHCGYETFALARFVKDGNYCPNCGARMLAKDMNVPNKKGADDE